MPLTTTTHKLSFSRPSPAACTFAFPASSSTNPRTPSINRITFGAHSTLSTQLHWHATHTEYVRVLTSAILVTVSGKTVVCTAEDGQAVIPRYARHELSRFDRPAELLSAEQREAQAAWLREQPEEKLEMLRETDLLLEEWTDPADGQKEVFFRNLFSTLEEPQYKASWYGKILAMVQVMCIMWWLDNHVVFVDIGGGDGGGWRAMVESAISYTVLGSFAFVGRALGLKAVNEEYTPKHLAKKWEDERPKTA